MGISPSYGRHDLFLSPLQRPSSPEREARYFHASFACSVLSSAAAVTPVPVVIKLEMAAAGNAPRATEYVGGSEDHA